MSTESNTGTKEKIIFDGLSLPTSSKYNNKKQEMVIFYKKWKKYNEIQLTKKMDLKKSKNKQFTNLTRAQPVAVDELPN